MRIIHGDKSFVSTHSRPKAAAHYSVLISFLTSVSTHSRPKVAAYQKGAVYPLSMVSTHSHPKVAAYSIGGYHDGIDGFNTQPPEGGCNV